MADLIHGGDIYSVQEKGIKEVLDFSANINPAGLPKKVKEAVAEGLADCVNYPDPLCRKLRRAIGKAEELTENQIICGNGAADIIFRLVTALKPKKAVIPAPTFAEYEEALNTVGCEVKHYYLKEEEDFKLGEGFAESLDDSCDMIFLCNPNNPTGQLTEKALLEKILRICREKNIVMVLDECFIEFVAECGKYTMKEYLKEYDNLFILKAFTKSYAMPGLRLGYGLSSNLELLQRLAEAGQPWPVSVPAQTAGIQALKEEEYLKDSLAKIWQERWFLKNRLEKLGIKTWTPAANYIFFKLQEDSGYSAGDFQEKLLEKNIIIRNCSNYKGLKEGFYRIAVKFHEDNLRIIKALEEIKE